MRRLSAAIVGMGLVGMAFAPMVRAAEPVTVKGELIDVKCGSDKKSGESHADCAVSCAKRGDPVAIFTKDGMYVVTGKFTDNKNAKLISLMAKNVEAKGEVTKDKDGKMTIDIASIAAAK